MTRNRHRLLAALLIVPMLAACGSDSDSASDTPVTVNAPPSTTGGAPASTEQESTTTTAAPAAVKVTSLNGASTLRAGLTGLLTEHVYLSALTTGALMRDDTAAVDAFAAALNGPSNSNSADLAAAMSSAYGPEVGKAFDGLWRSQDHIPAFVDYAKAVKTGDTAGAAAAVTRLTGYAKTFGTTLQSVNPNLKATDVEQAVVMHATTLLAVIDAQKAGDQPKVYGSLREAYHHMGGTAEVLAVATAKQFPDKFDGDASSPAADLRADLNALLREHVLLASSATGGALGGRQPQFDAAATALNGPTGSNTADIVEGITTAYGPEVGKAFDGLWRSEGHIPAVVAYTQAVAKGDKAAADKAVTDLTSYAKVFGDTLNSVNPKLPAAAVESHLVMHATTLKAVIDAQAAKNPADTAAKLRIAVAHMSVTADDLAEATVQNAPDKFGA